MLFFHSFDLLAVLSLRMMGGGFITHFCITGLIRPKRKHPPSPPMHTTEFPHELIHNLQLFRFLSPINKNLTRKEV